MNYSQNCIELIKKFEGCKLNPYLCPAGLPTIGFGHRIESLDLYPAGISQAQADEFLLAELDAISANLNLYINFPVNQNQFDALCSLIFNVGIGAFIKSQMRKDIDNGLLIAAANEFDDWNHVNGEVSLGLTRRRQAEKALFMRQL
jgi:lysozyme